MTFGRLSRTVLAFAALFACARAASAGTIAILTNTGSVPVSNGGTYNFVGYTGSVILTLDGPTVPAEIFAGGNPTAAPAGDFSLPVELNSLWMSLPATFDGSSYIVPNGTLTFSAPDGIVSVQLVTTPAITGASTWITANFRLSSETPEPGEWALVGGGLVLLGVKMLRRRRA
jgi:hypothetical protein